MTECAARLVDDVLPRVPVRQWVLSVPNRLRYLLAWDHSLSRAVLGVYARVLLGFHRQRARRHGLRDGRSGCVTVIQRFGGGLNLNVHFHTLVLEGVFVEGADGALRFWALSPPTDDEVGMLLAAIAARVERLLRRRDFASGEGDVSGPDPLAEESPALAGISSAAIQGRIALGHRAGRRVWRVGSDPEAAWVMSGGPRHAHIAGFDLHANVAVPAADRARLEQFCRYLLRPAVAQDRLRLLDDGRVVLALKTAWTDGTQHLVFEPLELLERLAAITPRPRINLVLYHGVLAPHARWRARRAPLAPLAPHQPRPARDAARALARLDLPRLVAILAAPTTGAPGLTQAGVLPHWHLADPCPSDRGCSNGGTADRDVPALLSDDLAGAHHRPRLRTPTWLGHDPRRSPSQRSSTTSPPSVKSITAAVSVTAVWRVIASG